MALLQSIPVFSGSASLEEFRNAYNSAQCVLFKGVDHNNNESKKRKRKLEQLEPLASISHIFQSATPNDQESWCIENETVLDSSTVKTTATATPTPPSEFLSTDSTQTGYCSFILQNDSQALAMFRDEIAPLSILPVIMSNDNDNDNTGSDVNPIKTAEPFWIFVGRNMSPHTILKGRSEHTDNIQHDGTFHYQLGGTKTWHIRPTQELMNSSNNIISFRDNYTLTLAQGDVMVINTRLWWHRTEIPPAQYDEKMKNIVSKNLSISYARDIYLDGKIPPANEVMSNVEGAWAVGFIPKGAELPIDSIDDVLPMRRTKSKHEANCKLIVLEEEDGAEGNPQRAVVMLRDIQESEFFLLWDEDEKIKQTSAS